MKLKRLFCPFALRAILTVGAAEKEPVDYVNASDYARRRLTVLVK